MRYALNEIREKTGYGDLAPVEQIGVLTALLKAACEEPDDDFGQWAARMYGADAITVSEMCEIFRHTPRPRQIDIVCTLLAAWHMTNNPQAETVIARTKAIAALPPL
jgi:hypothetical protein